MKFFEITIITSNFVGLVYLISSCIFIKKRTVDNQRMCMFLSLIWVAVNSITLLSSILLWNLLRTLICFFSLCFAAFIFKLNVDGSKRYRITMADIRELLDMYFLVYTELSMEGGFDLNSLEEIIRNNHVMEINKIMVERTLLQNDKEKEMFDFLMHLYGMDIRDWFRKCIRDITVWHSMGSVPMVDTHYYSLKRKIEFLDSMESKEISEKER